LLVVLFLTVITVAWRDVAISRLFNICLYHVRILQLYWGVEPLRVSKHFYQFVYSADGSRTCRSLMQLIWLCCVWVEWNERNSRIFKNTENTVHHLVEKVKLHSFWWMKSFNISIWPNFHMWWSNPFVRLSID